MSKRLRVVQVQVTVVTAIDDGADLRVTPNPQPVTIPTLGDAQRFFSIDLPAALVEQERALNAPPEPARLPNRAERRMGHKAARRGGAAPIAPAPEALVPNGVVPA